MNPLWNPSSFFAFPKIYHIFDSPIKYHDAFRLIQTLLLLSRALLLTGVRNMSCLVVVDMFPAFVWSPSILLSMSRDDSWLQRISISGGTGLTSSSQSSRLLVCVWVGASNVCLRVSSRIRRLRLTVMKIPFLVLVMVWYRPAIVDSLGRVIDSIIIGWRSWALCSYENTTKVDSLKNDMLWRLKYEKTGIVRTNNEIVVWSFSISWAKWKSDNDKRSINKKTPYFLWKLYLTSQCNAI